ncbi:sugar ABC transporter ATP-binding protein [Mesorhizobium sp. L-8-3]|uniref:sugar ABC transporter ATP-binding protein n=1 Tax=Mesorhizobium sp. L-8-3 TaxID=2744522 RepID=UPI0019289261|nr:sugar ABC transporter ATP-binding protein [Mesorhizobium sp. L-8-3]BCH27523.1 putative ribose/galactose/methyl galactoside import ATP-binding protein 1 [Mesorhizobium sp. L-8-3]
MNAAKRETAGAEAHPVCIRLIDVGKSFAGVQVLRNISLDFRQGEIHALVGENGAGKSTVGKIAGGYYSRSSGDLEIFGERVGAWDAATALARGIAMMHQELQLVPELTVAENVFLGIEHRRAGFLKRDEDQRLAGIVALCGFDLDPSARAGSLSIADQQKIEIMRAMARDARVIVMDEPTSSLTADEAERLHATMLRLKSMGRTVVYVSHFLDHVLAICDRVTIMRDGRIVRTADARDETKASLVAGMLGRADAEVSYPEKTVPPARGVVPLLKVEGLTADTGVGGVDFEIHPGEIVGLIGLVGSGRTEIARAVFGADPAEGKVLIDGERYAERSPERSVALRIAMVPEDRRKQGLVLTQTVRPNMTLPHLSAFSLAGFLRLGAEGDAVRRLVEHLGVSPRHVDGDVVNYSGGNQQKVLLGKWIMRDPKIVILDEPSRGVDLGARRRIHEFVSELAGRGVGVLLISSEMEEVLGLAHRAYLVRRGRIVREVVPGEVGEDELLWTLFQDDDAPASERRAS